MLVIVEEGFVVEVIFVPISSKVRVSESKVVVLESNVSWCETLCVPVKVEDVGLLG